MRSLHSLVLLVAVATTAAGPVAGQSAASASAEPILNPGDMISITVWLKPELSGEFPIMENGGIAEPFYMDVRVGGLPLSAAAERVRRHVEQFEQNPRVLVEPLFRVAVGGEVRDPGIYSMRPETSVLQTIMYAGGPTQRGQRSRIQLLRDGRELALDATAAEAEPVRSGDRIVVERRTAVFRDVILPTVGFLGSVASIIRVASRF